jgi:tripartite-type tricarboxylate transporter receptor subunit TctC
MAPRILVAVIGLAMALGHAQAQSILGAEPNNYPNRAIRIIVPFPPGGPADMIARLVGQRMSEDWGQPVLIENRAGGNTAIGAQAAARSPPDGYTLFAAMDTTMVLNPLVTPNLPYEPLNDFAPITLLIKTVALVVVRSDGPKTIKELIAKAKANPGKLNMAPAPSPRASARCSLPSPPRSTCSSFHSRAAPRSAKRCWRARSISPSTAPARACR